MTYAVETLVRFGTWKNSVGKIKKVLNGAYYIETFGGRSVFYSHDNVTKGTLEDHDIWFEEQKRLVNLIIQ